VATSALLLILLAALTAFMRLLLPWYASDPQRVAGLLQKRLGTEVSLAVSDLDLTRGTFPVLRLAGLTIGSGPEALVLAEAEVELDLAAVLVGYRPLVRELRVENLRLDIAYRDAAWHVLGLPLAVSRPANLAWLRRIGAVTAHGVTVQVSIADAFTDLKLSGVRLELRREAEQLRLSAESPQGLRGVLELAMQHPTAQAGAWRAYLEGKDVDMDASQQSLAGIRPVAGLLDFKAWLEPGQDGLRARVMVDASQPVLEGHSLTWLDGKPLAARYSFPEFALDLHAHWHGAVLNADWTLGKSRGALRLPLAAEASAGQQARQQAGPWDALELHASELQLKPLLELASASALVPNSVRLALYRLAPHGALDTFTWRGGRQGVGRAVLRDFGLQSSEFVVPSVDALNGELDFDRDGASFRLQAERLSLRQPGVFRDELPIKLDLSGALSRVNQGWRLEIDRADVQAHSVKLRADLALLLRPDLAPEIDLRVAFQEGNVADARYFLPINNMPPKTVEWFDRSFTGGQLDSGLLLMRGPLGKPPWPFEFGEGRFEAMAEISATTLDFHRDWPRAEALAAKLKFVNDSLWIEAANGLVSGTQIQVRSGSVQRYRDPILLLDLAGQGDASIWLDFLRAGPVGNRFGSVLIGIHSKGLVSAQAALSLPLKRALGEPVLSGVALLEGMDFAAAKWNVDFRDVRGEVTFSRRGFDGKALRISTPNGNVGKLAITVGAETGDPLAPVLAQLQGSFSAEDMFGSQEALGGVLKGAQGLAAWDVALKAARVDALAPLQVDLNIQSSLKGIALALPSPLGKRASEMAALDVKLHFPGGAASSLQLSVDQRVQMRALFATPSSPFRARLTLGERPLNTEPLPEQGLLISGEVRLDDPLSWVPLLTTSTTAADSTLAGIDLQLSDQPDGRLRLHKSDGLWQLDVNSPAFSGMAMLKRESGHYAVDMDFERLYIPKPEGSGRTLPPIDPRFLPALHLRARDVRFGDAQLGALRLESFPEGDGLRIDLLESDSPAMKLRGSGRWYARGFSQESEFALQFSADDLGKFLSSLGFAEQITGSQTIAKITAKWPGAPLDFSLERLQGTLDVWVGAGRFVELDPGGAGRLFGLLSLTALPRRLALDFRDFFQSGMAFDEITGVFALSEGNAWTENLKIRAPAADILVIGRTGIAARDYDQQVVVSPRVGSMLPIVGALAAGPGGAAAGLLAQSVLAQDRTFQQEYRIGGSWEKPAIEKEDLRSSAGGKRGNAG